MPDKDNKIILELFREKFYGIIVDDKIKGIMILAECSREKAREQANKEYKELEAFLNQALKDKDEEVKKIIKQKGYWKYFKKEVAFEELEDYTKFLVKHNYCDSDVYAEEPKAIEEYWKEKYS